MPEEKPPVLNITQKTLVPLGVIFMVLGGVIWLTTLFFDVQQLKNGIKEVRGATETTSSIVSMQTERITRLEVQYQQIIASLVRIENKIESNPN